MSRLRSQGWVSWDGLGATLSVGCAVHCALLPLAFALMPNLNLALRSFQHEWHGLAQWLLWTHEVEVAFISTVLAFAAIVLASAWRRHRSLKPAAWFLVAVLFFAAGMLAEVLQSGWVHVLVQVLGGLALALAHVVNLRVLSQWRQQHAQDASCAHPRWMHA